MLISTDKKATFWFMSHFFRFFFCLDLGDFSHKACEFIQNPAKNNLHEVRYELAYHKNLHEIRYGTALQNNLLITIRLDFGIFTRFLAHEFWKWFDFKSISIRNSFIDLNKQDLIFQKLEKWYIYPKLGIFCWENGKIFLVWINCVYLISRTVLNAHIISYLFQ